MAWETAPLPSNNTDHPHSSTQPGSQGARDKITPGVGGWMCLEQIKNGEIEEMMEKCAV